MTETIFKTIFFSVADVRPEEEGFMTYTAAHHQGAVRIFLASILESSVVVLLSCTVCDIN